MWWPVMLHRPVLIMAGGTGGHIYPALAVADYLREKQVSVLWLGTSAGLEARVVPMNNYKLLTINISGLRGNGLMRWIAAPFKLSIAIFQALKIMWKHKPLAVLGMGGYVSGPGGIAAWLSGIPLYLHEQNAIAGLTNRILSPLAKNIMQGFPETFAKADKVRTTGNPVRKAIITIPEPEQRFKTRQAERMRLLILGGSLGARKLNQTVPAALASLADSSLIDVWHQTGEKHLADTKNSYEESGVDGARIDAFIDDMAEAYAWADLVLCRAGALTVAELCIAGLAAILVPFPYAVDDHQTANAKHMSDKGAAVLLPEAELEVNKLAQLLEEFSHARGRLLDMAKISRSLSYPDATREVAASCREVAYA